MLGTNQAQAAPSGMFVCGKWPCQRQKTSSRVEKACEDAEEMSASGCGMCGLCTGGAMQLNTFNIWAMVCEKGVSL